MSIRLQSDRLAAEERKQNRDLLRAKGEELYILIDDFENDFRKASSSVAEHYFTKPNQPQGDTGDYNSSNTKFQRIDMLTNVYFLPLCRYSRHSRQSATEWLRYLS